MISDLLMRISVLNVETDSPLDVDAAIAAVLDSVDRDVTDEERQEFERAVRDRYGAEVVSDAR